MSIFPDHIRFPEQGPGPNGAPPRSLRGRKPLPQQLREASRPEWARAVGHVLVGLELAPLVAGTLVLEGAHRVLDVLGVPR